MDSSTLIKRLETAKKSFQNLELQLADPDVASDPKQLEKISRERSRLEPLVNDYMELQAIEREFSAGTIHKAFVADLEVERELKFITNPSRYTSRASEVFKRNILPQFASLESPLRHI